MPEVADHQNQFDMRLHQVPLPVDEGRPLDYRFSMDKVLACPEPKKNELQLFDPIQDDRIESCIDVAEHLEDNLHLSGEHHGYGRNGLGGVSTFGNAGADALQYNDSDPTLLVLVLDRKDLEVAQELVPGFAVLHGSINSSIYINIVRTLRLNLSHPESHKVKHAKQYARLLLRLANELTVLPSENPSCKDNFLDPVPYGECLDALAKDMLMGKRLGPQDSGVYVLKDHAPYVTCLRLLATELSSG